MKEMIAAVIAAAFFGACAYAESIDFTGETITVDNLADGWYDLTVKCVNDVDSIDVNTYLYGVSEDCSMASAVLPKTDSGAVTVTVRGIGVSNGKCEIGLVNNSENEVTITDADLSLSSACDFIMGGDMSEVSYIEALDGAYKDFDGNTVDAFEYLSANGMNMARIRLSNNPGKGRGDGTYYLPEGYQDEQDCLALAKRAHDAGMALQFTFNYSDYWSNGERQIIPSDWVAEIKESLNYDVKDPTFLNSMTSEQKSQIQSALGELVYDYTYDIMTKLKEQGTVPEYVSLGNEINGGIFFPFANTFDASMDKDSFELIYSDIEDDDITCDMDWSGLASILNRGYDAVKAVSPESRVVIHLAEGSKESVFKWFFDKYKSAGGKFDVIGASYYPAWSQNTVETCVTFCNNISSRYDKDILIMETGYNWNSTKKDGYEGQLTNNAPGYDEKYPFTEEGQAGFLADLVNALKGVNGGRCLGILYWDPCMIHVEDPKTENASLSGWAYRESDGNPDGNVVENTTLFDFDGKALPSVDVYKNSRGSVLLNGEKEGYVTRTVTNSSSAVRKVNLYVAVYNEFGVLESVDIDSRTIAPGGASTLRLREPEDNCKVFLWECDTLKPLN